MITDLVQRFLSLFDLWVLFGFAAQFVFFLRFAVQWWVSEKKKQSVIPISFWYLSLAGTFMILIYSIHRRDIVFIAASCLNSLIYIRNLMLIKNKKNKTQTQENL